MVDVSFPDGIKDSDWILFSGRVKSRVANQAILVPDEDDYISLYLADQDVLERSDPRGQHVFIRRRARLARFEVGPLSNFYSFPRQTHRCSPQCSGGCKCVGNVEFCCGGWDVAIGNCYGRWPCP